MKNINILLINFLIFLASCGQTDGVAPSANGICPSFTNGQFDTPTHVANSGQNNEAPSGWSIGGSEMHLNGNPLPVGIYSVATLGGNATVSQSLSGLTVGSSYTISFQGGGSGTAVGQTIQVAVNGVTIANKTETATLDSFTSSSFTATAITEPVVFTLSGGMMADSYLTNISLNCL